MRWERIRYLFRREAGKCPFQGLCKITTSVVILALQTRDLGTALGNGGCRYAPMADKCFSK